jgi:hypothetical protein
MTTLGGHNILVEEPDHNPKEAPADLTYNGGLSFKDIEDHVARYTYKPGWMLSAQKPGSEPDTFMLMADAEVKDSRGPDAHLPGNTDTVFITGGCELPLDIDLASLNRAIRWFIEYREIHELREWLKFDGDPVDYPPH